MWSFLMFNLHLYLSTPQLSTVVLISCSQLHFLCTQVPHCPCPVTGGHKPAPVPLWNRVLCFFCVTQLLSVLDRQPLLVADQCFLNSWVYPRPAAFFSPPFLDDCIVTNNDHVPTDPSCS
uniref:Secreted protein n=1 Tax=Eutreptiella gymnastica TaxID=73025 RepID=A0A6T1SHE4_9EUGL